MRRPDLLAAIAAVLIVGACRPGPSTRLASQNHTGVSLSIVTTIEPLAMIAREIGGNRVAVSALLSAGASPHTFEPRASDMRRISEADLVIRVGHGFDDWLERIVTASAASAKILVVAEAEGQEGASTTDNHETGSGGRKAHDPHLWLDPLSVRDTIAPAIALELSSREPAAAKQYADALVAFQTRLDALDNEIRRMLSHAGQSSYVAFHNAWRYFARRYGLHEIAVVYEFAGEEPTPRQIDRLITAASTAGVSAVLVEPQLDPRVAEIIAADFGAGTIIVDPLGDSEDAERSTYEGLMRFNARAFSRALATARRN